MWGTEAQAFVTWLNSITATATGTEVRLPRHDELQEETVASAVTPQLPASVTSAWTQPHLELWLRPGQPHPHELPGAAIRQAIATDAKNTALLPQILTAAVLDIALRIIRDLEDARALSSALADDLAARASSDGQLIDLMHAHTHAIVLTYAHALGLTRANAITHTCAVDPDLIRTLDLAPARGLANAIAGDLAAAIDRAHTRAVELADAIDLDLSVLSAFDFDVTHAFELARAHAADLDRAHVLAGGILHDPDLGLAAVFGLGSVGGLEPALPLPGFLGLPLRWVANGPLASTLLQALSANSPTADSPTADSPAAASAGPPGDPYRAFALALSSRAGIDETTQLRAALGSPLTDRLRDLAAAASREGGRSPDWNQATLLSRLTDACVPVCAAHECPTPADAAALRAVALALAGTISVPGTDAPGVLRAVAATVTAVENRSKGESKAGESIILALV
jgi:hypothetical protein